ncbi:diphthamide biosynthesis protein [Fomitopsis serialis]|uniref:diphthamide biosynthesis protein n=1 Tax=Fomitopsis serialis TaxID=139415 RepID=UPI0020073308|nr:diphthamide biosynthesis protein [Neoantrodia serialis]KAH9929211.1 diphthamide biosynthesis protein [Neoantrodia serialis]
MEPTTAFAASGEDAITRTIDLDDVLEELSPEELEDYYDIDRTVEQICKGDYKRIALQFPDELLRDSVPIFRRLKARLGDGRELYVLADTSYGSCCVDEVAAQHVEADAMVHYGHACMSQTSRLPVIYVFGKKPIDSADCIDSFVQALASSSSEHTKGACMLRLDVAYAHRADAIMNKLRAALPAPTKILQSPIPSMTYPTKQPNKLDQTPQQDSNSGENDFEEASSENCVILYVGGESLSLTNLLMTHASCQVYSYDPQTTATRLESARTNRLLMRRYATVQKARDADVFGILIGTLGVASYLPLISHLRKMLAKAHKKSYTISVGKLNPAKLANFLEIECFVLVACPENSLIEAKDFLRPIVTPYELEVALRAEQSWTGRYVLDFDRVLAEYSGHEEEGESKDASTRDEEDSDEPVFSLVTGKYRYAKRYGAPAETPSGDSSAVVLRNKDNSIAVLADSAAGQFLQTRTFQGLETRIGQDAPSTLEQGRSGIAKGYADDHRSQ